jgi:GT2 family glycosyltransferase
MLVASVVLFKNDSTLAARAVMSALATDIVAKVIIVDNSPEDSLKSLENLDARVSYIFNPSNSGFGRGHNIAIKRSITLGSRYHLVLNPDVEFGREVIPYLLDTLGQNDSIGAVMPKIVFPDGRRQYLCKLLPTPLDLILRRFLPSSWQSPRVQSLYELQSIPLDRISDVPTLSGCFLLMRTCLLKQLGGFDERFFMYLEDVDLVRRVGAISRTVFVPQVEIVHHYAKGSYKSARLLGYHIASAIRYFNKWGWVFDQEREVRNKLVSCALEKANAE